MLDQTRDLTGDNIHLFRPGKSIDLSKDKDFKSVKKNIQTRVQCCPDKFEKSSAGPDDLDDTYQRLRLADELYLIPPHLWCCLAMRFTVMNLLILTTSGSIFEISS